MIQFVTIKDQLYSWREKFFEQTGANFLFSAWKDTGEIINSVLISSLTINVLAMIFPLTLLQIYDRIIPNQSIVTLIWLSITVLISLILSGFLKVARTYVSAWADAKFEHLTGCKAFDKILNSQLLSYEKEGSGRHLKRISAMNMLKQFYAGQALTSLINVPFIFVFLLLIAYIGGWLVFIPIFLIAMAFSATYNNTKKFQDLLNARQDHDDRRLNFIVETISKIHTIKSNTMEAQMLRRYERLQKASSSFDYRMTQYSSTLISDSVVLSQLTVVAVVAFGSMEVFTTSLSVGALAACTLLAGQCLQPVNGLIQMWGRLQTIKIAHTELNKIMGLPSEISDDLVPANIVKGKITFEHVNFQYSESSPLLIKDLTLLIKPMETISISGEKLTGKSTILSLLLNLLTPVKGRILIDDQDIVTLSPETLRQAIGYMPQQAILYQGSLLDNLTMFDESYENVAKQLSEKIGLAGFVEHFPDGYDTKIGTQTTETLPRGIMQRIVIVRALIRKPPIILFDEADITLDMEGDKKVKELLEEMRGHHTMILISHRPSILAIADTKYSMENGTLRLIND